MVTGMATVKITVTLPEQQLQRIRALVAEHKAPSVSGFVQRAVELAVDETLAWAGLLSQALTETGGPLTDDERAWADSVLASTGSDNATGAGSAA